MRAAVGERLSSAPAVLLAEGPAGAAAVLATAGSGAQGFAAFHAIDGWRFGRIPRAVPAPGEDAGSGQDDQDAGGFRTDTLKQHDGRDQRCDRDQPPLHVERAIHERKIIAWGSGKDYTLH